MTEETVTPKEVMKYEENKLGKNWLCWIPSTSQAYYCPTKKKAKGFCDRVNKAFALGELKIDDRGRVVKINVA